MILPKAILCFALASTVYSHGPEHDHTADCKKVESLFYSLCSPDPIKLRTIQGLPGVVDYDKVNSTIEQKLKQALSEQNDKIAKLSASLTKAENERRALEERASEQRDELSAQNSKNRELTASLAKAEKERRALEGREGFCFVKYNGKCYWIETNYNQISCQKGREMCAARGGNPADIYSEEHYKMIKDYVRRQIPAGGWLGLWLGIRFDVRTMTTSLSDGTPAPFLKWHPGYPNNAAGTSCISFNVRVPWNAGNQDMHNYPDNANRQGVVCQKD